MISIPDTLRQRVTSIVLALYVGAFLGQALCVLLESQVESTATHASSSTVAHASPSMATHNPSQHAEHSGAPEPGHTLVCASAACASALTATADLGLEPLNRVSHAQVAYIGEKPAPDAEAVSPPPRLG